jgi:hypothetical protein
MRTCAILLNGMLSASFATLAGAQSSTLIPESNVTGLIDDLSARPLKGPNFVPGAVAVVNPQGSIDSAEGVPSDCVFVSGGSGPCNTYFTNGEQPSGIINGTNPTFTLSGIPYPPSSLLLFRNGLLQQQSGDYTVASGTVTFASASIPQPGDILLAYYQIAQPITPASKAIGVQSQTSSKVDYETFDRHLRAATEQAQAVLADFPLIELGPKKRDVGGKSIMLLQRRLGMPLQRSLMIDAQPEPMRATPADTLPSNSRGMRLLQNRVSLPFERRLRVDRPRPTHDPIDLIFVPVSVEPPGTSNPRRRLDTAQPAQALRDIKGHIQTSPLSRAAPGETTPGTVPVH